MTNTNTRTNRIDSICEALVNPLQAISSGTTKKLACQVGKDALYLRRIDPRTGETPYIEVQVHPNARAEQVAQDAAPMFADADDDEFFEDAPAEEEEEKNGGRVREEVNGMHAPRRVGRPVGSRRG